MLRADNGSCAREVGRKHIRVRLTSPQSQVSGASSDLAGRWHRRSPDASLVLKLPDDIISFVLFCPTRVWPVRHSQGTCTTYYLARWLAGRPGAELYNGGPMRSAPGPAHTHTSVHPQTSTCMARKVWIWPIPYLPLAALISFSLSSPQHCAVAAYLSIHTWFLCPVTHEHLKSRCLDKETYARLNY